MTHSVLAEKQEVENFTGTEESEAYVWKGAKLLPSLITLLVGVGIWMIPTPEGLTAQTWNLFAIFAATIAGIISRPLPIGPVVLFSIVTILISRTLTFQELFVSFSQPGIWMLVVAFFLAGGLIKTNLALRSAYWFMSILGGRTLGLAYGIIACETLLAPFIPSLVARSSCIIFPIVLSSAKELCKGGEGSKGFKTAGFLMLTALQGSIISSAIFLTGMAGNPLIAGMAREIGVEISWGSWFLAALVPGIISLTLIPLIIYWVYPPDLKVLPDAPGIARDKLIAMGKITVNEKIMMGVFTLVLALWLFGSMLGVGSTEACFLGVALLLFCGIITWQDCLKTEIAWDTLFWLSTLISLGAQLKLLGFFSWMCSNLVGAVGDIPWQMGFVLISILYFYSHYFFASNVAHVTAMYFAFLLAAIELGTPPYLAVMVLGFFSSIFGGLTHYGCGPAPVFFSAGYVSVTTWWKVGAIAGTANVIIWGVIGSFWLKIINFW
ncbi:MAG: DASS family divalent anion:Na+ symporter [Chlamydiales bacterium]|jgi:DASS family divalent anion:Na+ symporter